jgi:hypothetical protein
MDNQGKFKEQVKAIGRLMTTILAIFVVLTSAILYYTHNPSAFNFNEDESLALISEDKYDAIENGIHIRTGFVEGEGLMEVVNNCTNCHSAKLVTQNRMNKERWTTTIKWMQETQGLWDLGGNEEIIVTYLSTYYAPEEKGRRENLSNIEWYVLQQ